MARTTSVEWLALGLPFGDPGQELADAQPIGPDAVHGRDGALEHVVATAVRPGSFERQHVERLLHHAQAARRRATGRGRWGTRGPVLMLKHTSQNTTSSRTATSAAASVRASASERPQQVIRQPLGGLGADAGQPGERLDEPGDRLDDLGHEPLAAAEAVRVTGPGCAGRR